ncbi:membrane protein [Gordonia phage Fribs8]|uniref:Lipoprotein n=1 Tax=Gordonia phage Azira TaxID=3035369 RepID=A0AAF0GMZ5_9CAUD|nr:lipoprotein [Gordonia phage Azira]WGH21062.1 lipoprotein [Gordonia phage Azira]WNM75505.1 lipoprotein [Gordonia phage Nibbles]WNN95784.1 membrane protein [Gordonia phage Fribs8]
MRKSIAATLVTIAALFGVVGCSTMNQEWHNGCLVQAKDTLYGSDGNGGTKRDYRLSTSCGSFTVGDNISGGFNSWDLWNSINEGKTYDIKTGGYRIGFFSQFPNVLEVREVK